MSKYTEAKKIIYKVDDYILDCFGYTDEEQEMLDSLELAIEALEIADRLENVDIDKAVKKFCAEKKMGECDAICSFCFGGEIFNEGYNQALIDIRGNNNDSNKIK